MGTEKKNVKIILWALAALLSVFALISVKAVPSDAELLAEAGAGTGALAGALARLRLAMPGSALLPAALAAGLFALYRYAYGNAGGRRGETRGGIGAAVLAALFSLLTLAGESMDLYGALCLFYRDGLSIMLALLWLLGYFFFFRALLLCAFALAERLTDAPAAASGAGRFAAALTGEKGLWGAFAVISLCWTPYLVSYFPASVSYDATNQLNAFFGVITWYNNHPVLSTALIGSCLWLGRTLGSDNLGMFIYTLLQSLSLTFACAYSIRCMARWGAARWARWATLGFFALLPLWPFYAQWVVKDTLYIAFALIFSCMVMDRAVKRGAPVSRGRAAALFALGFLCCLLRKNGVLLVLPSLIALAFAASDKRCKARFAAAVLAVAALYLCWDNALVPAMGIGGSSGADTLSVPLQQTARCVRERGASVTDEEREAVSAVLIDGGFEALPEKYVPNISDPVKNLYDNSTTRAEKNAFLKAWLGMAARHPVVCAEAFFANTYAYYCPDASRTGLLCFGYWIEAHESVDYGCFDLHYLAGSEGERCVLLAASDTLSKLPVFSLLYSQGFYTWLLLALAVWAAQKKRPGLIAGLTPALATLVMCILSSVNGEYRYFMPVISAAPIMLTGVICGVRNKKSEERT